MVETAKPVIIVVEDETYFSEKIVGALRKAFPDASITLLTSYCEARTKLREPPGDIFISDMRLPFDKMSNQQSRYGSELVANAMSRYKCIVLSQDFSNDELKFFEMEKIPTVEKSYAAGFEMEIVDKVSEILNGSQSIVDKQSDRAATGKAARPVERVKEIRRGKDHD